MIKRVLLLAVVAIAAGCKKEGKVEPTTISGSGSGSGSAATTASGSGSGTTAVEPAAPPAAALAKPFFYEVTTKDGKTSWMLGTLHQGIDAEKQLPKVVWEKLDQARTFISEADVYDQAAMFKMLLRTDGTTLEQELGPEYWAKFEAAVGEIQAVGMKGMKTGISTALLQAKELPRTSPMDAVIHGKAVDGKKEIVFLESASSQMVIIDKWLDARMLKWMLDNPRKVADASKDLYTAYATGDDAGMVAMFGDSESWVESGRTEAELAQFLDEILFKRNAAWIPKLEEKLAAGNAFVAVGAGHLVGPKSVNDLLAAKGYTVKRVEP
jgi:uncharacterized protein YbaP (TraB family)